jgi:hypothetical protein
LEAFTPDHFRKYVSGLVFDDGEQRDPQDWQLEVIADVFKGFPETWLIVPEGNGKSTLLAQLALYGADFTASPWIPVGASSAKVARIIFDQAEGFVTRTPWLGERFKCFGGYKIIRSFKNGVQDGVGIEIFAADTKTGDGVIPFPFAIVDELHRHDDLRLYSLWKGKLRKRGGQILTISTAGEPETEFENTRDAIRRVATKRERVGAHLRAEGPGLVLHEWMVESDELCSDMAAVAEANPLWSITEATLAEDFASPTLDLGDWKRLKCNRPTRSVQSAITDKEWDDAQTDERIPAGATVDVGLDWAPKWDTTALVPLWMAPKYRLLGPTTILVPPRDGSQLHPDEVMIALEKLADEYTIGDVVMDTSHATDIAARIEDDMGLKVIDRAQTTKLICADYEAFMDGLRNGTLKHTGDVGLRSHVLHAIARRLPGGDYRFDRPVASRRAVGQQDRRVIDALTAAAMVVEHSNRAPKKRSVYEERFQAA